MKPHTSRRRTGEPLRRSSKRSDTTRKRGPPPEKPPLIELGIAGRQVPIHSHLAYFWETEEDFDKAAGFLEAGLRGTDHCVALGDKGDIARILGSLEGRGLDVADLGAENRLTTLERSHTADETIAEVSALFEAASAEGASVIRLLGNVGWGRATGPRDAELASLEARFTPVARRYPSVVLCLHEVRSLTGPTARHGVLRTHPQMLDEAGVLENPFFVPYERFRGRLKAVTAELSKGQDEREASRRQAEILQAVFDNIPVMISFVDPSGQLLLVNREWERVLGWSFQEAQGYNFLAEAYPDPESRREVLEFMRKAEQRWQDFRTRTKDGRIIDTSWLRVGLSNGTRIGFGLDLTERKRLEKGIRTSEALLAEGERLSHTGSWALNLSSGKLFWSAESFRIYGLEPGQETASHPFFREMLHPADRAAAEKTVHPGDWSVIQKNLDQAIAEKGNFEASHRVVRPDGSERIVHSLGQPVFSASGEILEYVGVVMDVTERKRAEEALRKSERVLREAEELGQTGSWEHDLVTGEIFNTEENLRLFFGDDRGKGARLEDYIDAVHPDDREMVTARHAQLLAEGGPRDIEYRVIRPDGSVHVISGRATVVRDESGQAVRIFGTNVDVTERKRTEDRLRLARESLQRSHDELRLLSERLRTVREEERTRIAREVHDEIGQALTALQMDVAWLEKKIATSPKSAGGSSSAKLKSMAKLLDTTLGSVQRIATELRPGVLDELGLDAATEWYVREFESRTGIPCDLRSDLKGALVEPDLATAVFRILQEALTNVARHSGAGRVEIRLAADRSELRLEVRDDGRGMPKGEFTATQSLGLLGMRERARSLGGDLLVRGVPDVGTTVTLRVPL